MLHLSRAFQTLPQMVPRLLKPSHLPRALFSSSPFNPILKPIIPQSFDSFRALSKNQRDKVIKLWKDMGGSDERDIEKWCIEVEDEDEDDSDTNSDTNSDSPHIPQKSGYTLQFDGGSRGNPGPSGSGYVLYSPSGLEIIAGYNYLGSRTNNYAEYTGLIEGLKKAKELGVNGVCEGDSKLVISQMNGVWKVKHRDMAVLKKIADEVKGEWEFKWIPRAENCRADEVANIAMDREEDGVLETE